MAQTYVLQGALKFVKGANTECFVIMVGPLIYASGSSAFQGSKTQLNPDPATFTVVVWPISRHVGLRSKTLPANCRGGAVCLTVSCGAHAATARLGRCFAAASPAAVVPHTHKFQPRLHEIQTETMAKKGGASTDKKAADKKAGGKNTAAAKNDDSADSKKVKPSQTVHRSTFSLQLPLIGCGGMVKGVLKPS